MNSVPSVANARPGKPRSGRHRPFRKYLESYVLLGWPQLRAFVASCEASGSTAASVPGMVSHEGTKGLGEAGGKLFWVGSLSESGSESGSMETVI